MANLTLTRVANFLKSEWVLIFLAALSITIFLLAITQLFKSQPLPIPTGTPWQSVIYPGKTTKQELESVFGSPINTQDKDGQIVFLYPSANEYRPHQVEFSHETVELIKEQVIGAERGTLDNYIQKYGQPERILYGQHGTFAPGHFWGQAGLLVFAGQFDKTIVEIWYFAPTTLENFLQQHSGLSTEEPHQF